MNAAQEEMQPPGQEPNSALELLRRHRRVYFTVNGFYYGTVLLGMAIAILNPSLRDTLLKAAREAVTEGPLRLLGAAYTGGSFLHAFGMTFLVNLLAGSLLSVNVPSAIIPFSGLLVVGWRALLWGILFSPGNHPLGVGLYVHYGTLLLEGQAYILAAFSVCLHGRSFLAPRSMGAASHCEGYVLGLKHTARLYLLVVIVLLIAASYEAFTGVYVVPSLVPK